MASGPCLRRCRVVRRYMPIRVWFYRLDVKSYPSMHMSMSFAPFWEGNAVNTGVPCPKVPMHRKLGLYEGQALRVTGEQTQILTSDRSRGTTPPLFLNETREEIACEVGVSKDVSHIFAVRDTRGAPR